MCSLVKLTQLLRQHQATIIVWEKDLNLWLCQRSVNSMLKNDHLLSIFHIFIILKLPMLDEGLFLLNSNFAFR